MRLLQTDMGRPRCRRGWERGSRQVQPPARPPPAAASPWGSQHRDPPAEDQTSAAKELILSGKDSLPCPQKALATKPIACHAQGGTGTPKAGGTEGAWLPPNIYCRSRSSLCYRVRLQMGAGGCPASPQNFPRTSSSHTGNPLGAKIPSGALQGCKEPTLIPHARRERGGSSGMVTATEHHPQHGPTAVGSWDQAGPSALGVRALP